jgi:hypothetical protein
VASRSSEAPVANAVWRAPLAPPSDPSGVAGPFSSSSPQLISREGRLHVQVPRDVLQQLQNSRHLTLHLLTLRRDWTWRLLRRPIDGRDWRVGTQTVRSKPRGLAHPPSNALAAVVDRDGIAPPSTMEKRLRSCADLGPK